MATVEVLRADPSYRRRALAALVALVVCGAVAVLLLPSALSSYGPRTSATALLALVTALALMCASAAATGIFVFRRGRRVLREGRFPASGERVLCDTVVLTGQAALKRGRILTVLGATLFLSAVALAVVSWRFYALFSARAA